MKPKKGNGTELIRRLRDKFEQLKLERDALEIQTGIKGEKVQVDFCSITKEPMVKPVNNCTEDSKEEVSYREGLRRHRKNIRAKVRDSYFSVSDRDQRKRLITTHRKIEQVERQLSDAEVESLQRLVDRDASKLETSHWLINAICAMFCVAVGSEFGTLGAIYGAVFGIFLGQEGIRRYHVDVKKEVAIRRRDLKEEKRKAKNILNRPVYFKKEEERGVRDRTFDDAYYRVGSDRGFDEACEWDEH